MRKMAEICILLCCIYIFLTACSVEHDNYGEPEITDNEGGDEMVDFNFENTVRVLEEVLDHPVTEGGFVVGAIRDAGIRGAIHAEWTEPPEPPRSVIPSFIIESEDNRVYRVFGHFSHMSGRFMVDSIRDMKTGETIFGIIK